MSDSILQHVSKYAKDLDKLSAARCKECAGFGWCDDSEICNRCKGVGYEPVVGKALTAEMATAIGEQLRTAMRDVAGKEHPFALVLIDSDQNFSNLMNIKFQYVASASRLLSKMVYHSLINQWNEIKKA